MKIIKSFSVFIAILLFTLSVNAQWKSNYKFKGNNSLLPQTVLVPSRVLMYDTTIYSGAKFLNTSYDYTKITYTSKPSIQEIVANNVLSGKHTVYHRSTAPYEIYSGRGIYPYSMFKERTEMPVKDVKESMGERIDTVYTYDVNTGELIKVAKKKEINLNEIKSMYFVEEWYFDADAFTFEKNVLALVPVRHYYREDDLDKESELLRKCFEIHYDKKQKAKKAKLVTSIEYEFYLTNQFVPTNIYYDQGFIEKEEAPLWSSLAIASFIDGIFHKALSGQVNVYKYNTNELISLPDLKERCGLRNDTIMIEENYKTVVTTPIISSDYRSVIFIEDWYLDEETLVMKKVVKGIAPVKTFFKDDDIDQLNPLRKVPFVIYFDKKYEPVK